MDIILNETIDKFNRKEINLKTKQNYHNYLKIWVTWLAIE